MIALLQWYFERLRFWLIVMLGLTSCGIGSAGIVWIFSKIFGKAVAETYFVGRLSDRRFFGDRTIGIALPSSL
jgi:hypothetical protein